MRTVRVTRNEHDLIEFTFDDETARATGMAAFTMEESEAKLLAEDIGVCDFGTNRRFVGIVHDGGEIVIDLTSLSDS